MLWNINSLFVLSYKIALIRSCIVCQVTCLPMLSAYPLHLLHTTLGCKYNFIWRVISSPLAGCFIALILFNHLRIMNIIMIIIWPLPRSSNGDLPHCQAEVSPAQHGYSAQQPKKLQPKAYNNVIHLVHNNSSCCFDDKYLQWCLVTDVYISSSLEEDGGHRSIPTDGWHTHERSPERHFIHHIHLSEDKNTDALNWQYRV